jgi:hypothetical protein
MFRSKNLRVLYTKNPEFDAIDQYLHKGICPSTCIIIQNERNALIFHCAIQLDRDSVLL